MLFLLYGLSALLCIAALVAKLYFGGFAFPLALLIPAFVFLVVGMLKQQRDERPVEFADLEEWQREELESLLESGQYGTAVRQVQLWFRGTSHERAEEIVQHLT